MNLQDDSTLIISDDDLNRLVADALDRNVLYCSGADVMIGSIVPRSEGDWEITFTIDEKDS